MDNTYLEFSFIRVVCKWVKDNLGEGVRLEALDTLYIYASLLARASEDFDITQLAEEANSFAETLDVNLDYPLTHKMSLGVLERNSANSFIINKALHDTVGIRVFVRQRDEIVCGIGY